MARKLFLLDGMALVYRAHFALMRRPIFTSKGVNTSALYGFTQTLLEILNNREPSHLGVAFDTAAPTQRHVEFPAYKAQREEMPEELSDALPHVRRLVEAFNIPVLTLDGFEADDIIGTLVRRAEKEGYESYMVTPDKDFSQLVDEKTFMLKPARAGDGVEILGLPEIRAKWGVERPEQVIDILGLWGDASDNIPGVPGIGEKTAIKLISQYGSIENLLAHTDELKGKMKENLETHRDQALLSRKLATILCDAPIDASLDDLKLRPRDDEKLKSLFVEFEFNALGKRLFGDEFKAGRGFQAEASGNPGAHNPDVADLVLTADEIPPEPTPSEAEPAPAPAQPHLKTLAGVDHEYHVVTDKAGRRELIQALGRLESFCFDTETTALDPKQARLIGLAFSFREHTGYYVTLPADEAAIQPVIEEFRSLFENEAIEKVGHNLKFDLSVLKWHGIEVRGRLFDTMLAHSLIEPDMRHGMDYLSEVYLGYSPVPITRLIGEPDSEQINMADVDLNLLAEYAAEDADVTWQLRSKLEPLLREKGQERVFYEIELPLLPVLVDMEHEGVRVDAAALDEFAVELSKLMAEYEQTIHRLAGREFNVNSPRQLGEILFDELKIADKPRKTRTGQYATNEQTLLALAARHEIVQRILDYRAVSKLKSTYADTLPEAIWPKSGRVHTTYNQAVTSTGRLQSQNPNLQNIPIRTEQGQEIRKAFVARDAEHLLLAADYSQIELRIIAALSRDAGMLEAFQENTDIHTATAARVFGVALDGVTPDMRRKAKMVNFGLAYGMSAFGLSQRLGIPRKEAAEIIEHYFKQFSGIQKYMAGTIEFARKHGYVETITGRRRYLRDINSSNATVRGAAERNAINMPIQGTAADMIKIAMANIHRELLRQGLHTRMLLQVHDELVFDLYKPEEKAVRLLIEERMKNALPLDVPILVEMGIGKNWLEAH